MTNLVGDHPVRFLERCFRPDDVARNRSGGFGSAEGLADSWAAKEAFLKALGTDVQHIPYRDIELTKDPRGQLVLNLYGEAREAGRRAGVGSIQVDISHTPVGALAWVVLAS